MRTRPGVKTSEVVVNMAEYPTQRGVALADSGESTILSDIIKTVLPIASDFVFRLIPYLLIMHHHSHVGKPTNPANVIMEQNIRQGNVKDDAYNERRRKHEGKSYLPLGIVNVGHLDRPTLSNANAWMVGMPYAGDAVICFSESDAKKIAANFEQVSIDAKDDKIVKVSYPISEDPEVFYPISEDPEIYDENSPHVTELVNLLINLSSEDEPCPSEKYSTTDRDKCKKILAQCRHPDTERLDYILCLRQYVIAEASNPLRYQSAFYKDAIRCLKLDAKINYQYLLNENNEVKARIQKNTSPQFVNGIQFILGRVGDYFSFRLDMPQCWITQQTTIQYILRDIEKFSKINPDIPQGDINKEFLYFTKCETIDKYIEMTLKLIADDQYKLRSRAYTPSPTPPSNRTIKPQDISKNITYKKNKHDDKNGEKTSKFEMAFSSVASLFMRPRLTPDVSLVLEGKSVSGVAVADVNEMIPKDALPITRDGERFRFLNKEPDRHFLKNLLIKHDKLEIKIDMDSLASVLTASYALEEDNLHKGKIGYYMTQSGPVTTYTFFKVDHGLLMSDSIMSRIDPRFANLLYDQNSFQITSEDLLRFPDLRDSSNHYWPTYKRTIVSGDKAYSSEERDFFKQLNDDDDFKNAKWKYFLKYILMSDDAILNAILTGLDHQKDAAQIDMIEASIKNRMANLRHVLFATKEFRDYVDSIKDLNTTFNSEEQRQLSFPVEFFDEVQPRFNELKNNSKAINTYGNNMLPLHVSIYLGEYRVGQIDKMKKEDINRRVNIPTSGELMTALDLAYIKFMETGITGEQRLLRASMLKDLISLGALPLKDLISLRPLPKEKKDLTKYINALTSYTKSAEHIRILSIGESQIAAKASTAIAPQASTQSHSSSSAAAAAAASISTVSSPPSPALSSNYHSNLPNQVPDVPAAVPVPVPAAAAPTAVYAQSKHPLKPYPAGTIENPSPGQSFYHPPKVPISSVCVPHQAQMTFKQLQERMEFISSRNVPLKHKKQMAITLIQANAFSRDDLKKIALAINKDEPDYPFTFINQLRSKLWIIRKIRGTYGYTSTRRTILSILASKEAGLSPFNDLDAKSLFRP